MEKHCLQQACIFRHSPIRPDPDVVLATRRARRPETETLYREVIEGKTAVLGADHESPLRTKGNSAAVLEEQGKLEEAGKLYLEVIEGKSAAFGVNHAETLL